MYKLTTDEQSQPQIDALPADALAPFAEAGVVLELARGTAGPTTDASRTARCGH